MIQEHNQKVELISTLTPYFQMDIYRYIQKYMGILCLKMEMEDFGFYQTKGADYFPFKIKILMGSL
jgi:hypothetical protein